MQIDNLVQFVRGVPYHDQACSVLRLGGGCDCGFAALAKGAIEELAHLAEVIQRLPRPGVRPPTSAAAETGAAARAAAPAPGTETVHPHPELADLGPEVTCGPKLATVPIDLEHPTDAQAELLSLLDAAALQIYVSDRHHNRPDAWLKAYEEALWWIQTRARVLRRLGVAR
jgi:hypothetical protein